MSKGFWTTFYGTIDSMLESGTWPTHLAFLIVGLGLVGWFYYLGIKFNRR